MSQNKIVGSGFAKSRESGGGNYNIILLFQNLWHISKGVAAKFTTLNEKHINFDFYQIHHIAIFVKFLGKSEVAKMF